MLPHNLEHRTSHRLLMLRSVIHLPDAIRQGVADPMLLQLHLELLMRKPLQLHHLKHISDREYSRVFEQFQIIACDIYSASLLCHVEALNQATDGKSRYTFRHQCLNRLIGILIRIHILQHPPKRVRAVLLEPKRLLVVFFEIACERDGEVGASDAQDHAVSVNLSL